MSDNMDTTASADSNQESATKTPAKIKPNYGGAKCSKCCSIYHLRKNCPNISAENPNGVKKKSYTRIDYRLGAKRLNEVVSAFGEKKKGKGKGKAKKSEAKGPGIEGVQMADRTK